MSVFSLQGDVFQMLDTDAVRAGAKTQLLDSTKCYITLVLLYSYLHYFPLL